jgi:hypothetical protein
VQKTEGQKDDGLQVHERQVRGGCLAQHHGGIKAGSLAIPRDWLGIGERRAVAVTPPPMIVAVSDMMDECLGLLPFSGWPWSEPG